MRFKWFHSFQWLHSKLTFVIIPETNAGIIRVKMSRGTVYAALFGLLALLGTAVCWYGVYFHKVAGTLVAEARLHDQASKLQQDLTTKNKTIERLQKEIFGLSQQAAVVRGQVEEMKRLESELLQLTSSAEPGADAVRAGTIPAEGGKGGPLQAATDGQVKALASAAHESYISLAQEMNELHSRWKLSKGLILQRRDEALRVPGLWPTLSGMVTSPFGYRKDPFTDKLSFHRGIDIAGKMNDPVYAAAKGTVVTAGFDKLHGNHIVLDHGNGLRTWYMHLNALLVHSGQTVERGQSIGRLGTSGRSTGPHLHYEIVRNGKSTDPKPYLPEPRPK